MGKLVRDLILLSGHAGIAFVLAILLGAGGMDAYLIGSLIAILATSVLLNAETFYLNYMRWPARPNDDPLRAQVGREMRRMWQTRTVLLTHGAIWLFGLFAYTMLASAEPGGVSATAWLSIAFVWTLPLVLHALMTSHIWRGHPNRADALIDAEVARRLREHGLKPKNDSRLMDDPFESDDEPDGLASVGDDGELETMNGRR